MVPTYADYKKKYYDDGGQTGAQSAAETAQAAKDIVTQFAYNGSQKVSPEVQKIIDEFNAKMEALQKSGELTNEKVIELIDAACSAIKYVETNGADGAATMEEIMRRIARDKAANAKKDSGAYKNVSSVSPSDVMTVWEWVQSGDFKAIQEQLNSLGPVGQAALLAICIGIGLAVVYEGGRYVVTKYYENKDAKAEAQKKVESKAKEAASAAKAKAEAKAKEEGKAREEAIKEQKIKEREEVRKGDGKANDKSNDKSNGKTGKVGENGTKTDGSKTTGQNGKTERVDVENLDPGKRDGMDRLQ